MGYLLGYARVSTTDQHPQLQVDALQRAGCYRVFTETASGARSDRPILAQVLDQLRPGDTLVVWKLDRLGRSLRHLIDTITGLADRGIGFRSLQEAIDTTTPGGKLVFHVFAALAEFERDSSANGRTPGWPRPEPAAATAAGATCRLAALLHLASHLRDGWAQPISLDTFAAATRLADYLVEHARAVFDLMGADPHLDDARWLLDWITRTNRTQFSRRDAHRAAPRGHFPKATDLEPALRLLEEHGYLRRVDPEPSQDPRGRGRPASPRFLVNSLPRAAEMTETPKTTAEAVSVDSGVSAARGDTSGGRR
jgi:hypothetical protein